MLNPVEVSDDQWLPLSAAGANRGSTENADEVMVSFDGKTQPSIDSLSGFSDGFTGTLSGPSHTAVPADESGLNRRISTIIVTALIESTGGGLKANMFEHSPLMIIIVR